MQQKLYGSIGKVLFDSDLIASRLMLACAELIWAAMLLWPGDTFSRKAYEIMREVAPETAWGLAFLAFGLVQLYVLLTARYNTAFARAFAGLNSAIWCFVTFTMMFSIKPPAAALSGDIVLAMVSLWIFVRPYVLVVGFASRQEF